MARFLEVYPKAILDGSTWELVVKVHDQTTGTSTRIVHTEPAGVTSTEPLTLLKLVLNLETEDTATDQDVADALLVDDIKPGGQTETVWERWRNIAEGIIDGLRVGFTREEFQAAWGPNSTNQIRNGARFALIDGPGPIGRGWTILAIHQHEGDGSVLEGDGTI